MSLKSYFAYPKFAEPPYRLLLIEADLYLQAEMATALRALGHTVKSIPLALARDDPGQFLTQLLHAAVALKPDAMPTENHAGFDDGGKIASALDDLGLPVIVWHLDDFRFLIGGGERLARLNTLVFTFERCHLSLLRAARFRDVHYLPPASTLDPAPHGRLCTVWI